MKFTDAQIKKLLTGIYSEEYNDRSMPEDLYFAIADHLKKALYEGFGGSLIDFTGKPEELLAELRENVYMFSGAKTFQQVKEMSLLLTDGDKLRSFSSFKAEALQVYERYNVNYLRTEYDTAIASGQQAYLWNKIEEDKAILPYLKFTAVLDANTTVECRHMDGIVAPVDSKIWSTCYPPNHWWCRSSVLQTDEAGEVSSKKDIEHAQKATEEHMQGVFKMNVGKDKVVFSPEHPYFEVSKRDKAFAKSNFGLPVPEKDVDK